MPNHHASVLSRPGNNNAFSIPVVLFLVLSLCSVLLAAWIFRIREKEITRDVHSSLSAIADLKAEQIIQWCDERKTDAEILSTEPYVRELFENSRGRRPDEKLLQTVTSVLKKTVRLEGYSNAAIVDTSGRIAAAAVMPPSGFIVDSSEIMIMRKTLAERTIQFSGVHRDPSDRSVIHLHVTAPVALSGSGAPAGTVLLSVNAGSFLFPLVQSWPTASRSAEVLLVRKDSGDVLFLNELRHRSNTALSLRLPLTEDKLPAARALRGEKGAMTGRDYRGVEVLAVAREIPGTQWHMIAKMDRTEAFAEVHRLLLRAMIMIFLILLLMGVLAALYERHRTSRIYKNLFLTEQEKNRISNTLAESEERFRRLFTSMTEGAALHDVIFDENGKPCNYRIVTVNPAYERHTGLSLATAEGKLATELYGTDSPPYMEEYATVGLTGKPYFFETYFPPMEKHFAISVFSPGKNQFATIFEDITVRKTAADKLRESEERFRRIFEDGMYGMALVDKTFTFIRVNDAFGSMLGYSEEELKKLTFKEVTHPDHRTGDMENVKMILQGTLPFYKTEKRYLRRDGGVVWGAVIITSLRNSAGDFQCFLAMIEDITDRKKSEDALIDEKERLAVTLRSIGDAVIATDEAGRIVLMNGIAETLTGWNFSDAEGKPLTEIFVIINELTRQPCENPVEKVLRTGAVVLLENHTVLLDRNGCERIIADSGAPIRDRQGTAIGVVLVFRDTTEKQQTQQALIKAQQLESLGVLAGGIAHDFNNLLGGLFGYLDLARESIADDHPAARNVDKAFSVFARAKDLTGQLLTFAKGGAPARKIRNIAPLLRDTVQFALSGSPIKTGFSIANDLWSCNIDEYQISQVLDNLVINARDAMPRGGAITIAAANIAAGEPLPPVLASGNYIRISLADQGTGIAPDHLQNIFDPFFTTKQKGSGLGLAVSFSIIARHDGTIVAESILGKGSTFHVYLPASGYPAAESGNAGRQKLQHHGSGRILIMDDEEYIRDIAADMLRNMGYDTVTVSCGEDAVAQFREATAGNTPFILALLDLTIPGGMGGRDACPLLREISESCILIASSGYSNDPIIAHPSDFGFNGSIRKPFRKIELTELLEQMIKPEK